MTHELKTPIASISLAAQMMNDDSAAKTPAMQKHLSGVVADESKRLRFLVEKVLQMSMFDKQKYTPAKHSDTYIFHDRVNEMYVVFY